MAGRSATIPLLLNKRFIFANTVLDADGIISLPKLKTHGLTRLTGAVKNQFGCVPGLAKGQFHAKMADPYDFSTMLVDINTFLKPRLYVMDAIMAMEGNGPRNGKPRQMNALMFSKDPIALDAVACKMVVLIPNTCPPLRRERRRVSGRIITRTLRSSGRGWNRLSAPTSTSCASHRSPSRRATLQEVHPEQDDAEARDRPGEVRQLRHLHQDVPGRPCRPGLGIHRSGQSSRGTIMPTASAATAARNCVRKALSP